MSELPSQKSVPRTSLDEEKTFAIKLATCIENWLDSTVKFYLQLNMHRICGC
jgi:hypothetical protein